MRSFFCTNRLCSARASWSPRSAASSLAAGFITGSFRGQSASFVARPTLVLFPNLRGQSGEVRFADLSTRLAGNRVDPPDIGRKWVCVVAQLLQRFEIVQRVVVLRGEAV